MNVNILTKTTRVKRNLPNEIEEPPTKTKIIENMNMEMDVEMDFTSRKSPFGNNSENLHSRFCKTPDIFEPTPKPVVHRPIPFKLNVSNNSAFSAWKGTTTDK
jgi:hypothetical protein